MTPEELKQKRHEFLDDMVAYYSEDTSRRAVTIYGIDRSKCNYRTPDGKCCAIGRHITDEQYDETIEGSSVNAERVFKLLPAEIQSLGKSYLDRVQSLHDFDDNWKKDSGLSERGIISVDTIRKNINAGYFIERN